MKTQKQHKALTIANAILSLSNPELGDVISNLKLQKLLYYCQGFHIALYKTPLFKEEIEAWQYGPVVPSIYRKFKKYNDGIIPPPDNFDFKSHNISDKQGKLLEEVYNVYGQFSGLKLMKMTHRESPWVDSKMREVITTSALKKYFSSLVKK